MDAPSPRQIELYESAIRAKETAIRLLIRENRRLKAMLARREQPPLDQDFAVEIYRVRPN